MKLTIVLAAILIAASIASAQTIVDYRGIDVQSPDPTGAAGLRLQNNFKELADRIGPSNLTATTAPTTDDDVDDGYYAGSLWYDTVGGVLYWCADNTDGAAVWLDLSTAGGAAAISDLAYATSWDGVTTVAPSKNAIYDYLTTTMGSQAPASVAITGGTISGVTLGQFATASTAPSIDGQSTLYLSTNSLFRIMSQGSDGTDRSIILPLTNSTALTQGNIGSLVQEYDLDLATIAGLAGSPGDLIIRTGDPFNSAWSRLAKGSDGQFLKLASGLPSWSGITASNISDKNAGTDVTADLEEETHASEHAVSGADTVFPADPGADRILMWDDDSGQLVWTTDTDTTYSAGDGLDLTGTTFSTDLKSGGGLEIESGELRLSALEAPATAEDTDDAETVDFSANLIYKLTLNNDTGPCVLSFTDPPAGSRCLLVLIQDADGGETVTWPAAETIYWAGGEEFVPDDTASSRAVVTLVFDGTDYYCTGYDYATP